MTSTNVKPKAKGLPVLAIMLLCILVASCGVLSKKEEQKQTDPVSWRERSDFVDITKISDPITPEGMKPIEYTGKMVKQDHSMYPEFVDSLKKGLIEKKSKYNYFKGIYLDSIPTIIQKVFPDVYFLKGKTELNMSSKTNRAIAYYNKKYTGCVWDFNDLYFRMNHESDVLLNEKLLAIFVSMYSMSGKNKIKISGIMSIKERKIENTGFKINYKFNVVALGKSIYDDLYCIKDNVKTWYFYDDRGIILYMGYFKGNSYNKIYLGSLSSTF